MGDSQITFDHFRCPLADDGECAFGIWQNPGGSLSVPPISEHSYGVCDLDSSMEKAFEREVKACEKEQGFYNPFPVECPIYQGQVDAPWEKDKE